MLFDPDLRSGKYDRYDIHFSYLLKISDLVTSNNLQ